MNTSNLFLRSPFLEVAYGFHALLEVPIHHQDHRQVAGLP